MRFALERAIIHFGSGIGVDRETLMRKLRVGRKPVFAFGKACEGDLDGWFEMAEANSATELEFGFRACQLYDESGFSFFGSYADEHELVSALESHFGPVEQWGAPAEPGPRAKETAELGERLRACFLSGRLRPHPPFWSQAPLVATVTRVEHYGLYVRTANGRNAIVLIPDVSDVPVNLESAYSVGDSVTVRLLRWVVEEHIFRASMRP